MRTGQAVGDAQGLVRSFTAQVCEVNKGGLTNRKRIKDGNAVVLGEQEGSYIKDAGAGGRVGLNRHEAMCVLKMCVGNPKSSC